MKNKIEHISTLVQFGVKYQISTLIEMPLNKFIFGFNYFSTETDNTRKLFAKIELPVSNYTFNIKRLINPKFFYSGRD